MKMTPKELFKKVILVILAIITSAIVFIGEKLLTKQNYNRTLQALIILGILTASFWNELEEYHYTSKININNKPISRAIFKLPINSRILTTYSDNEKKFKVFVEERPGLFSSAKNSVYEVPYKNKNYYHQKYINCINLGFENHKYWKIFHGLRGELFNQKPAICVNASLVIIANAMGE